MKTDPPPNGKPGIESGICCRKCGCRDLRVVYTRHRERKIVRARECRHCGSRLITTERANGQ